MKRGNERRRGRGDERTEGLRDWETRR